MDRRAPPTDDARKRRRAQARATRQLRRRRGREYTGRGSLPLLVESLNEDDRLLFTMSAYMSTRAIEDVTREYAAAGKDVKIISSSEASRRLIEIGDGMAEDLATRPLDPLNPVAIAMDATGVGRKKDKNGKTHARTIAWAIAVCMDGTKVPLGIAESPTEGQQVYTDLLNSLRERGLDSANVLWITDGGSTTVQPALQKFLSDQRVALQRSDETVVAVDSHGLNVRGVMQRCLVHKARNVIEDNLNVSQRVAIGRRLVKEHLEAVARGEADTDAHRPRRVNDWLLEKLREARGGRELSPDDAFDSSRTGRVVLREVAERVIRRELWHAWDKGDLATAEAGVRAVARWLEDWGHTKAAASTLEGIDEQLTLQRLGVTDAGLRRLLQTTNLIESPHAGITPIEVRHKNWQHETQRLRVATTAIAQAERSWTPFAERSQIEEMNLRVLAQRHPSVELKFAPGTAVNILQLAGVSVEGERVERIDAALGDLLRWADANDRTVVIPNDVAADLPSRDARRRGLQEHGFTAHLEHRAALTRTPRPLVTRSSTRDVDGPGQPRPSPGAVAALSEMRQAIGGDRRLLTGIADAALRMAPEMLNRPGHVVEREAGYLDAACRGLASLKDDVTAWGKTHGRAAVDEIALNALEALSERRERPDPLRNGRHLVLQTRQADWLRAAAAIREEHLKHVPAAEVAAAEHAAASRPLGRLDPLAGRVEQAARVVAAAHALDFHRQIAFAQEGVTAGRTAGAEGIHPVARRPEGALSQIERRRGALGRHADAMSRLSDSMAPVLQELPDAALLELRADVGDPWRHVNPRDARLALAKERDRANLLEDRDKAVRAAAQSARQDEQQSRWPRRRGTQSQATSHFQETAQKLDEELCKTERDADDLAKRDDSLDRFLVEHPEVALHDALDTELDRRIRERGVDQLEPAQELQATDPQLELEPAAGADMGIGG